MVTTSCSPHPPPFPPSEGPPPPPPAPTNHETAPPPALRSSLSLLSFCPQPVSSSNYHTISLSLTPFLDVTVFSWTPWVHSGIRETKREPERGTTGTREEGGTWLKWPLLPSLSFSSLLLLLLLLLLALSLLPLPLSLSLCLCLSLPASLPLSPPLFLSLLFPTLRRGLPSFKLDTRKLRAVGVGAAAFCVWIDAGSVLLASQMNAASAFSVSRSSLLFRHPFSAAFLLVNVFTLPRVSFRSRCTYRFSPRVCHNGVGPSQTPVIARSTTGCMTNASFYSWRRARSSKLCNGGHFSFPVREMENYRLLPFYIEFRHQKNLPFRWTSFL